MHARTRGCTERTVIAFEDVAIVFQADRRVVVQLVHMPARQMLVKEVLASEQLPALSALPLPSRKTVHGGISTRLMVWSFVAPVLLALAAESGVPPHRNTPELVNPCIDVRATTWLGPAHLHRFGDCPRMVPSHP